MEFERVDLPQGVGRATHRCLEKRLAVGESVELYSGVIVGNAGRYPCSLKILTPRSEAMEALREEFFEKRGEHVG